jgi:RNA polymerase sigma-54 factor
MVAAMAIGLEARATVELRLSPQLLSFTELLALPVVELEQRIERELERNPALERVETEDCRLCAGTGPCRACAAPLHHDGTSVSTEPERQEELAQLTESTSLAARLLAEARLVLAAADLAIAEYLVGSLDARGFLIATTAEVASALRVPLARVERVLRTLQALDPPGVAARDARECLLLQLDRLAAEGRGHPLARKLVAEHLVAVSQGRTAGVAAALGVPLEQVTAARDFIRRRLWPFPADPGRELWARSAPVPRCYPDVVVREAADGSDRLEVEVRSPGRLRIEPFYRALAAGRLEVEEGASRLARRHAVAYVRRGESFLGLLSGRAETLQRVVGEAASYQREFLRRGAGARRPLTRAAVARRVGLHESTVSRAVAGKFALLPCGRLVSLGAFFDAAPEISQVLRRLIAGAEHPLNDGELTARLAALGYRVARRTVAKYRSRLGFPAEGARS